MNDSHKDGKIALYREILERQAYEDQLIRDACGALLDSYSAENRERLRVLLEERLKIDEMLETATMLIREPKAEQDDSADAFGRRKNTPLTLLKYRTGAMAKMPGERQRRLRAIWKADLRHELSAEQFQASDAASYGRPGSQQRLNKIIEELRWNGFQQSKLANEDSARHFNDDADYLESLRDGTDGVDTQH